MTARLPAHTRARYPSGMRRGLALAAVSGLFVVAAAGCGDEAGTDAPSASDPGLSASSGASTGAASTPTEASSALSSAAASGDPVASPVIDKAVRRALAKGFPALVPAGVPADWAVVAAGYTAAGGGSWTIELTTADGSAVTLIQAAQPLEEFLSEHLGAQAQQSGAVDLGQNGTGRWKVYTDGAATTVIATRIAGTSALVSGPDQDTVVELAELLLTAEDSGSGTGDG